MSNIGRTKRQQEILQNSPNGTILMHTSKQPDQIKIRCGAESMWVPTNGRAHRLVKAGWVLLSHKKRGMITMEQWNHPELGTHSQGDALALQQLANKKKGAKHE